MPADGTITYATDTEADFEFGTTATYSCVSGYALLGGSTVRTCGPDLDDQGNIVGGWSGQAPECLRECYAYNLPTTGCM